MLRLKLVMLLHCSGVGWFVGLSDLTRVWYSAGSFPLHTDYLSESCTRAIYSYTRVVGN